MTLLEIRTLLFRRSGRADLIDPDTFADTGADVHINAGVRHIESMVDGLHTIRKYTIDVAANQYLVDVKNARTLTKVTIEGPDGEIELDRRTREWMRKHFSERWSEVSPGTPAVWTPVPPSLVPQQAALTTVTRTTVMTYAHEELMFANQNSGESERYMRVLLMPPADTTYTISVYGKFGSKELADDDDFNFWTLHYPDAVVWAALRDIEGGNRNTEGVRDFDAMLAPILRGIDVELSQHESVGIKQIRRAGVI